MSSQREPQGQGLAALGGAGLVASLWLPWYTFHLPQAAVDSVAQAAKQFGALGPLVTSGAQLINQLGPIHITAWQAFTTTPAVLLVVGIIAGGLSALALTERAGNTSQLTILAALVGAVLIGYKIAVPPGQGSFVHPTWGIYLALVGALLMLGGGALAGSDSGQTASPATMPNLSPDPPRQVAAAWPTAPTQTAATAAWSSSPGQSGAAAGWSDSPAQTDRVGGWSDHPPSAAPTANWPVRESVPPPAA